jgi:predicted Holliday junction resolvase-like endonuclease
MSLTWTEYCKNYSQSKGVSYKKAMAECKDEWQTYKMQQKENQQKKVQFQELKKKKAIPKSKMPRKQSISNSENLIHSQK